MSFLFYAHIKGSSILDDQCSTLDSAAWAPEKTFGRLPSLCEAYAGRSTVIINQVSDWIMVGTVKTLKCCYQGPDTPVKTGS